MSRFYTNVAKKGNKILVRGYENGKRFNSQETFKPWLFLPDKDNSDSKYKTLNGKPVKRVDFTSLYDFYKFKDTYKDIDGFNYYGLDRPEYLYIYKNYFNTSYDVNKIKTCIIDIEVATGDGYPDIELADREITAITLLYPNQNITVVFGYKDFDTDDTRIKYIKCKDEKELLTKFLKIWTSDAYGPDVISGWNIKLFDIPYIINRIIRILGDAAAKTISPWNFLQTKKIEAFGRNNTVFYPVGIALIDYYDLYKKFVAVTEPQETYTLDHIAFVELEEHKLDYSEYGSLHELYVNDHQKFIEYNIRDCTLIQRMNDKRKLFELVYIISYSAGVNFADALGTVTAWDVAIHNFLINRNIVVPQFKRKYSRKPAGGYVKDPIVGRHDWVVSFDLTSLYPHLIMGYNIGPDTLMGKLPEDLSFADVCENKIKEYDEYLIENNCTVAGNSYLFSKNKVSFLSELMKEMFEQRKKMKEKMIELEIENQKTDKNLDNEIAHYDTLQYAFKVRLNSAYGALASQWFRWYDINLAEAITLSGQTVIKWAEKRLNEYLNDFFKTENSDYVIAVDTDSVYINLSKLDTNKLSKKEMKEFIDAFCKEKLEPFISEIFKDLSDKMHCIKQAMHMKREVIADAGVFIAKKRYALNMLDKEGVEYETPKLKIMGLESVRSSTPTVMRDKIEEAIKIILQQDEPSLQQFIKEFREEYEKCNYSDIAFNSSVNKLSEYKHNDTIYGHKCPIYYRGALLYNHYREKYKLKNKIAPIYQGEKIKYVYLTTPNPINEDVISTPTGKLPEQLGLHEYIDYDTQFDKSFIEPVKSILDKIHWTVKPINTLKSFWD